MNLKTYVKTPEGGECCVSTVSLTAYGVSALIPTPYETMVFPAKGEQIIDFEERYEETHDTEKIAAHRHEVIVERVRVGDIEL